MAETAPQITPTREVTSAIAERASTLRLEALPPEAVTVARQCLLDYLGVTYAGCHEPLVSILLEQIEASGGHPQASLLGLGRQASVEQAALLNGAAGHAHDYDDVHDAIFGHPTVPVAPAVLALGEHLGSSGEELLAALIAGIDTECLVGRYVGPSHYAHGWHATATIGTFGAAAAAARLLGASAAQTATAMGIAGTEAAGLKSMFGTMCKPLHAGRAAANGVAAASLAVRGFTSRPDVLEAEQGFAATQSTSASAERFEHALATPSFVPDTLFKYHAACYLTHSSIEAARRLRERHGLTPERVRAMEIRVDEGHFGVCNIARPTTALEAKFSLRFTAAMALAGMDTASIDAFTDALTADPALTDLCERTRVSAHPEPRRESIVRVETDRGERLEETFDVRIPDRDLERQQRRLEAKFARLVDPVLGEAARNELVEALAGLEQADAPTALWQALRSEARSSR